MVEIDYGGVMSSNKLDIYPHEAGKTGLEQWNHYSQDPTKKGTITIIECAESIYHNLEKSIQTDISPEESLSYELGFRYYDLLRSGHELIIHNGTHSTVIPPIHPLYLNNLKEENIQTLTLKVYRDSIDSTNIRVYFPEKGKEYYRVLNGKRYKNMKESPPADAIFIGTILHTSAYASDEEWRTYQKECFTKIGVTIIEEGEDGIADARQFLGGYFIQRNRKIIGKFIKQKAKAGDKARYDYVRDSRHLMQFTSDDSASITLDDIFHVEINKSKIERNLMEAILRETDRYLCERFVTMCYKKYTPSKMDDSDEDELNEEEVPPPTLTVVDEPAPSIIPSKKGKKKVKSESVLTVSEVVDTPIQPINELLLTVDEPEVAPVLTITEPALTVTEPAIAPVITVAELVDEPEKEASSQVVRTLPAPTYQTVKPHTRGTSKSSQEVLLKIVEFVKEVSVSNISEKINTANTEVEAGLLDHYTTIDKLINYLRSCGITI